MLDLKAQSQLVDATSALMRAYLAAASLGWTASASRGLALWVDMLGSGSRRGAPDPSFAVRMPFGDWPRLCSGRSSPRPRRRYARASRATGPIVDTQWRRS
jgi:hypothetical protein